jgi:hypothetical protein
MLDNVPHIKAFWIATGVDVAQTALWFGADDLDGTVQEERIYHMAGSRTPRRSRPPTSERSSRRRPRAHRARHALQRRPRAGGGAARDAGSATAPQFRAGLLYTRPSVNFRGKAFGAIRLVFRAGDCETFHNPQPAGRRGHADDDGHVPAGPQRVREGQHPRAAAAAGAVPRLSDEEMAARIAAARAALGDRS